MDKPLIMMKALVKELCEPNVVGEHRDEANLYVLVDYADQLPSPLDRKAALVAAFLTILEARSAPNKTLERHIDLVFKGLEKERRG